MTLKSGVSTPLFYCPVKIAFNRDFLYNTINFRSNFLYQFILKFPNLCFGLFSSNQIYIDDYQVVDLLSNIPCLVSRYRFWVNLLVINHIDRKPKLLFNKTVLISLIRCGIGGCVYHLKSNSINQTQLCYEQMFKSKQM